MKEINFYADLGIWPYLPLFLGIWKGFGYSSVMQKLCDNHGIDPTYYEAATVDGASNGWQTNSQRNHSAVDTIGNCLLTILAVGNIFRADFGLSTKSPTMLVSFIT